MVKEYASERLKQQVLQQSIRLHQYLKNWQQSLKSFLRFF